ncbi:MAG: ADP-ribosylglycohydrolase family protein [Candidatus Hydrogenedentes bacterium]|jgi:hypothetical protein|nr:ADP-ribosylglycohydrolase family protein [Candidatus Hydrogenedentota bacterium]
MRFSYLLVIFCLSTLAVFGQCPPEGDQVYRELSADAYKDRMTAAWIGQMAGVGWGVPTEFKFNGRIIPEADVPAWAPEMVNQFEEDDLYVEMTFIRSLEEYGWSVSLRQAGIDFANSKYQLWHANKFGRRNLREGIAPPDSGHPQFNSHADDIDYQIEADFSGILTPGLPAAAVELGERFGRLMNYGDGLYGGQFIGAMYSEAFFEQDPKKLVEVGLRAIPEDSQYHECISDVLRWYGEEPKDWQAVWHRINEKYHLNPDYRRSSCSTDNEFNIDAKINGAYVVMGLLYGDKDPDKTIEIAMRCGQDSDCNPSSAAGILFATLGCDGIPEKYTQALKRDVRFSYTSYSFDELIAVCEKLCREAILHHGGTIKTDDSGKELFCIPEIALTPGKAEQCHTPGPIANSRFSESEMAQITEKD